MARDAVGPSPPIPPPTPPAGLPRPGGHAPTHTPLRAVVVFTIGLGVTLLVLFAIAAGYYVLLVKGYDKQDRPTYFSGKQPPPPGPRLQVDPAADLLQMHQREEATLHSYAWVDHDHGIVRIPIDDAMALYLRQHGQEPSRAVQPAVVEPTTHPRLPAEVGPIPAPAQVPPPGPVVVPPEGQP